LKINYTDENEITNFREVCLGDMKNNVIFRGSYPIFRIDETRDKLYDKLVSDAGINCVVNLSGNSKDMEVIGNLVPWYNVLLKSGKVIGLDIQFEFDFLDKFAYEVFNYRLRLGFKFLLANNGPYLLHCNAGADRTGFVAAILGLLCGAKIDEVIYDYLLSHGKEFADAHDEELNRITGRIIYGQMNAITGGKIEDSENLQANIKRYFLENIGLTEKELEMLKGRLMK